MVPIGTCVQYLLASSCNCLGRIRKCGLVGAGVSLGLGLEVSKVSAFPRDSLFASYLWIKVCP